MLRVARALPIPLNEATVEDLDRWQASLKVSRSSVATYTSHVRAFYRWAHESGRIADNPAANLPIPKLPRRLPRPIPERHLILALQCARGSMLVWLVLAGWCGLRAGEISRLRDESVIETDEGIFLRVDGKGGKERIVPVPEEIAPIVRGSMRPGAWFRTPSGRATPPRYISRETSQYLQSLGLPYVLHQLRHRFGTQHYRLCRDIRQTQELMGHGSPATTALYTLVAPGAMKSMKRLGKTFPKLAPDTRAA
ncbi:tyrosine-type recombinase/integrase [Amycolatopsis alkalitolerans]|uniref:Integrase n=1 Tax=Amycolatopsis alkalitolerans TaxID=2547244 RepID=A0A5C4LSF0_9PSEU|nr:tyrosine-type recombinase/integrase [Amycolatopsis alkalitolerans]TNC19079.1 integrase [Amycolatopsis alkalitolerans]